MRPPQVPSNNPSRLRELEIESYKRICDRPHESGRDISRYIKSNKNVLSNLNHG